jgi:hypothetical protein
MAACLGSPAATPLAAPEAALIAASPACSSTSSRMSLMVLTLPRAHVAAGRPKDPEGFEAKHRSGGRNRNSPIWGQIGLFRAVCQSGTARARPPPPWARPHRYQPSRPELSAVPLSVEWIVRPKTRRTTRRTTRPETSATVRKALAIAALRFVSCCQASRTNSSPDEVGALRGSCVETFGHDGVEIIGR